MNGLRRPRHRDVRCNGGQTGMRSALFTALVGLALAGCGVGAVPTAEPTDPPAVPTASLRPSPTLRPPRVTLADGTYVSHPVLCAAGLPLVMSGIDLPPRYEQTVTGSLTNAGGPREYVWFAVSGLTFPEAAYSREDSMSVRLVGPTNRSHDENFGTLLFRLEPLAAGEQRDYSLRFNAWGGPGDVEATMEAYLGPAGVSSNARPWGLTLFASVAFTFSVVDDGRCFVE